MRTLSARVLLCTALARFSAGATFPDPGTSWPEAEETLVEGLEGAKGFVEYGSVPFLLFSDLFPEVATSENASQNAGVWTSKRTQAKLAALSVAVNAKWVDATLLVVRAWMPPRNDSSGNCGQNEERPTYYNEGRAVDVQLMRNGKVETDVAMMAELATLAAQVKFDFVRHVPGTSTEPAYIYLSSISDNCQTKVELMFVVDMSGSIAAQGYKSELQFISNLVDYFDIGPTQTQVSMISYDSNNRLDFDFKTHSTAASLKSAISSASYAGGGTSTSKAIDLARTQFSSTSSGVRPDSEGVSKVLVVLTDGSSDDEAGAIAAAEKVKALNVNIFTIGLGSSLNRNELLGMATEPQEEHFIELSQVKDIEAFSSTMATYSCNEPAKINPGESFRTDISDGEMRYVEPSCQVLTDHFIVDAYDLKGFTSLFVSTQSKNPGPFDYEKKSEVPGRKRIYMETPGNDPIYIGLWSLRCGANRDEITDSEVSFDFLNDIFNGFMIDFAEVREHQSEGLEVYRPKAPSFSKGVSIPNIVYSLENADDTIGANSTLPFAINPSDGTVTTSEELEFDENQKWRIRILAHADGTAELSRCIRGGMEVIVSVIPDSTSPTTTATSTATSTATTTATSTATTTEDPAIAAAAARAKAQRTAIGAAVPIVLLLLLALLAFLYVRDKRKWPTEKEIMAMDMDECKECLRAHGIDPKIEYPEIRFTDQIRLLLADLAGHNSTYSKKSFALKEAVWPKSKEEIANMKRFDMLQILKKNGSPNASKLKKTSEIRGLLLMASGFAVDVIADTAPKMFNDGSDDAKSNVERFRVNK